MSGAAGSPANAHPRYLILGTAGHVDHGKTELVRALTGHDTDRLKEEKERGISIELGFAPLPLADDTFVGIVDVPGHERFVRQMVSGAGGIDMAILLVAADEGVMPQTEEHMEVLTSLRIGTGAVVLSKCDLAGDDTMPLVREDVAELVRGTFLEEAPVVETSAKTGAGIDSLKATILELARSVPGRDSSGPFRLAVDRVFHQRGIGVVVTGSCYSGTVRVGDTLELLPSGARVRLRELQSFGEERTTGSAGERLAMALQGVKLTDVHRGDTVATSGAFAATNALDARVQIARYDKFVVRNRERVRIHHGAREVLGRIILLDCDVLKTGESALVQLRLETPLVPGLGDSLVLRKYSPMRVAGGGVVIDPSPERHRRFDPEAIERLQLREKGDPVGILLKTMERAGLTGIPFSQAHRDAAAQLEERGSAIRIGDHLFATAVLDSLAAQIGKIVSAFVERNPLQWGIDKEELRERVKFPHGPQLFNGVLDMTARRHNVFVRENRVRAGAEELRLNDETRQHLAALGDALRKRGVTFATRSEIEPEWKGRENFADAVQLLKDSGDVIELEATGLVHRDALASAIGSLREIFATIDEASVGDVKDALGLTRKHVIPLLEYFDARRVTTRVGNVRRKGPAFPD